MSSGTRAAVTRARVTVTRARALIDIAVPVLKYVYRVNVAPASAAVAVFFKLEIHVVSLATLLADPMGGFGHGERRADDC